MRYVLDLLRYGAATGGQGVGTSLGVVFKAATKMVGTTGRTLAWGRDSIKKRLGLEGEEVDDDYYTKNVDPRVLPNRPGLDRQIRQRDNFGPFRIPDQQICCMDSSGDIHGPPLVP